MQSVEVREGQLGKSPSTGSLSTRSPRAKTGPEIEISAVEVLQLTQIDLVAETFKAQIFVQLRFKGGNLNPDLASRSREFPFGPDGKPTFRPSALWFLDQLDFNNGVDITIMDKDVIASGDDLLGKVRFEGTFTEHLELEHFPFDTQALTASLAFNCRVNGPVPLRVEKSRDMQTYNLDTNNFHLKSVYKLGSSVHVTVGTCGHQPRVFPAINLTILVRRKPNFFVTNVIVPMFIFVPLACMQQAIPLWELADRLGFGLTMLLTTVAFKTSVSSSLPQISYLTLLDKYLLFGALINCIICFQSAITWRLLANEGKLWRKLSHYDALQALKDLKRGPLAGSMQRNSSAFVNGAGVIEPAPEGQLFMEGAVVFAASIDDIFFYTNLGVWFIFNLYVVAKVVLLRTFQRDELFVPKPPESGVNHMLLAAKWVKARGDESLASGASCLACLVGAFTRIRSGGRTPSFRKKKHVRNDRRSVMQAIHVMEKRRTENEASDVESGTAHKPM